MKQIDDILYLKFRPRCELHYVHERCRILPYQELAAPWPALLLPALAPRFPGTAIEGVRIYITGACDYCSL